MTAYTFSDEVYSDLHKDAYGFRPSAASYASWNAMSDDEKQEEWERLVDLRDHNDAIERAEYLRCQKEWELRIQKMQEDFTISEATAIRWDMEALGVNGDIGFYCFMVGIAYDHETRIMETLN